MNAMTNMEQMLQLHGTVDALTPTFRRYAAWQGAEQHCFQNCLMAPNAEGGAWSLVTSLDGSSGFGANWVPRQWRSRRPTRGARMSQRSRSVGAMGQSPLWLTRSPSSMQSNIPSFAAGCGGGEGNGNHDCIPQANMCYPHRICTGLMATSHKFIPSKHAPMSHCLCLPKVPPEVRKGCQHTRLGKEPGDNCRWELRVSTHTHTHAQPPTPLCTHTRTHPHTHTHEPKIHTHTHTPGSRPCKKGLRCTCPVAEVP